MSINFLSTSVCMATYNGSKFIKKQVDSILKQLSSTDELIIVDDCSIDDTVSILNNYNDKRIRIYINERNFGVVYSFNKALGLASGDIIFLSDQDDKWEEKKVSTVLSIFQSKDVDLIVHDAIIISDFEIISESLFFYANSSNGFLKNLISNTYTGCCMVFKRSILNRILPIPQKKGIYHDSWIGIMSDFYNYKISFENIRLIEWYRHDKNESSIKTRSFSIIIIDRVNLILAILYRFFKNSISR